MPRYQWQDTNIIQQVDLSENLSYRFAYLYPKEGLSSAELDALPDKMQRHGLVAFKDVKDGKPVLRVRDFSKGSDLFRTLQQEGLVQGSFSAKEPLQEELDPTARSLKKYIKKHSIELAGISYLFADAMPIMSGLAQNNRSEVTQGLMWATTSAVLALFGRKSANVQMGSMYTKMKEYLYNEGIDLPEDESLALQQLQRDPNYWNKMINFFYEHPVLFNNTLQGIGGVMQAKAGHDQSNPFKTAAGACVAAGQWAGMIIPEDKYAGLSPEEKTEYTKKYLQGDGWENGLNATLADPVSWVKERPLRLTGILPGINNLLSGWGAWVYDRDRVDKWFGVEDKKLWPFAKSADNIELLKLGKGKRAELKEARRRLANMSVGEGTLSASQLRERDFLKGTVKRLKQEQDGMLSTNIGRKYIAFSPIFNLIANTLYGISSKEDRSDLNTEDTYLDEIITLGANVYANMPEEQRTRRIVKFAGFIAHQPDIVPNQQQIAERVTDKVAEIETAWGKASRSNVNENDPHEKTRNVIASAMADAGLDYTPSNKVTAQGSAVEVSSALVSKKETVRA